MTGGYDRTPADTSYKIVLPFYAYAALAFLVATVLLLCSPGAYTGHFFQPAILAVTHTMALGWGTMIILGASYQLVPVLTESRLFSTKLGGCSFISAAFGIPLLVYGFYTFRLGWAAQAGGAAVVVSAGCFVINLWVTISKGKTGNVQAIYMLTASIWLLLGMATGLALLCNLTEPFLPKGALAYLPLHAHIGIIGWFLLLVTGVGSRLIPLFLISKYSNERILWWIYLFLNGGLLSFIVLFWLDRRLYAIPETAVGMGLLLFGYYCCRCYRSRIRKKVEAQLKVSLASVGVMAAPLLVVIVVIGVARTGGSDSRMPLIYGFLIFFGWITGIILGMTFKTLPFIIWNKVYQSRTGIIPTPNPKKLVKDGLFKAMMGAWAAGLLVFAGGIWMKGTLLLRTGAGFLAMAALLYNYQVFTILIYKERKT
jgi:hypothetical protein